MYRYNFQAGESSASSSSGSSSLRSVQECSQWGRSEETNACLIWVLSKYSHIPYPMAFRFASFNVDHILKYRKKRYNLISPMIMTANSQELHVDHDLKKKQLHKYWKWVTVVETSLLTPWAKVSLSEFHVWFLCWPKTMTRGKHLSFSTIHLEEKD